MLIVSSTLGWLDDDRLEAALQGRVLLDVLAVLIQRGGADAVQFAARQQRLQHVGGVHGAFGRARAHDRVQLVDEQDDATFGLLHFLEHGLQALLELAAVLGAGDQRAQVHSATTRLFFRPSGTSPRTMRWARPSTMAVLPTPGSPMRTGLFLVRRERTWITRRIFLVTPDDRVELALAREIRQVAAVLGQRVVLLFRVFVGDSLVAADVCQRGQNRIAR